MKRKLTDALIAALPAGEQTVLDSQLAGFGVRVSDAGVKSFFIRAQAGGRRPKVTFDRFPDVSVSQARVVALQLLADQRRGLDPRRGRRWPSSGGPTVAAVAERWMTEAVRVHNKPRTIADYEILLAKHILPALGGLSIVAVTRDDVVRLHTAMARTRRRANYTVSTVRALFNFAIDVGLRAAGSNPVRRIRWYRERKIERFLTEAEIARAGEGIAAAERQGWIGPHAAAGLRLALLTGARSGEVTAAQWIHFDPDRRLIRLPDSKTNEPRTIHLSDAALEVLHGLPRVGPYIVAGAKAGEPYKNLGRAWIKARGLVGLDDVRLHDLRHSYASLAAGRGVSLQMIGKLLGHKVPATTQRYAHLARDAAAAVNDELGAVMAAAIERGTTQPAAVVKLRPPKHRRG
jgi:integrase